MVVICLTLDSKMGVSGIRDDVVGDRGVGTGGATGARATPIFCVLALAAASHARTTRNATGEPLCGLSWPPQSFSSSYAPG